MKREFEIGQHRVVVEVIAGGEIPEMAVIHFKASCCGQPTGSGRITLHPNPDWTIDQLSADVSDYAARLAAEAAGLHEAHTVKERFFCVGATRESDQGV